MTSLGRQRITDLSGPFWVDKESGIVEKMHRDFLQILKIRQKFVKK